MYASPRDLLVCLSVRLLHCLGLVGNNHQTKDSGTTADDGLSTRKSSRWCRCYVMSGNAADGGLCFLAFAVAPRLLLLVAALVRATRQAAAMPLPFLKTFAMPNAWPHASVAVPLEALHNALPIGERRL